MTTVSGLAGNVTMAPKREASHPVPGEQRLSAEQETEGPETADGIEAAAETEKNDLEVDQLEDLAKEINQALARFTSMNFRVDQDIDQVVVQVVDSTNGDVLRQIPQEKLVDLAKHMHKVQGMLFDVMA